MNNPLTGFHYFLEGFHLIFKPGIRSYVIIPLIINILFFIGLFFLLFHYMQVFNLWFATHLPSWLHWLEPILWLLFFISFVLIAVYTFVIMANLIAAPFNSLLSEKVERYLTAKLPDERSFFENVKDLPRIIGRQLLIIGYYLPRAFVILLLFFIPLIQAIAGVLWFLFTAWMMALTYVDYPTDNHRISFKEMKERLRLKRFLTLGFGMSVLVASMIPILNFFAIPAAVAGATKLWVEEEMKEPQRSV